MKKIINRFISVLITFMMLVSCMFCSVGMVYADDSMTFKGSDGSTTIDHVTMEAGRSFTLVPSENVSDQYDSSEYDWSVSDGKLAKVDNGVVTIDENATGSFTVTATMKSAAKKTATCKVTIGSVVVTLTRKIRKNSPLSSKSVLVEEGTNFNVTSGKVTGSFVAYDTTVFSTVYAHWDEANEFIKALNSANYGGYNDWQLLESKDMANAWWKQGGCDNTKKSNLITRYWSSVEYNSGCAYVFNSSDKTWDVIYKIPENNVYLSEVDNFYYGFVVFRKVPETPTITTQPKDQSTTAGKSVTFSLDASTSDSGKLSYQWYKQTSSDKEGVALEREHNQSIELSSPTTKDNNAQYYCVVTNTLNNSQSTTTSKKVTLTVEGNSLTGSIFSSWGIALIVGCVFIVVAGTYIFIKKKNKTH